jgi:hypothetical protein
VSSFWLTITRTFQRTALGFLEGDFVKRGTAAEDAGYRIAHGFLSLSAFGLLFLSQRVSDLH